MKFISMDTETGGTDCKEHSLLSVGMVIWDNGDMYDEREWYLKQKEYKVSQYAMEVNGIDFRTHMKDGMDINAALKQMTAYKLKHFGYSDKVKFIGINTAFDVNFLREAYVQNKNFDFFKHFDYHVIDVTTILNLVHMNNLVTRPLLGLQDALEYFNINPGVAHTALDDARATGILFSKLQELIRGGC
jgi:DNA polymerase III epsilon subunit-like protein